MLQLEIVTMANIEHEIEYSFALYTYTYGDDPNQSAGQFYSSQAEAREDLVTFRASLIRDDDRDQLLPDMKIIELRTCPINQRALVELFNGMNGDLGGFIRSRRIVEVITEPQLEHE
ncbi:hypothetical protein Brsp07_01714 [Brucella sp. NBRC 14130]|jgi:hypothetical protein|uniref:Uncharacterized protein n=3 Tax=Brucella TaxID=234 RepID=A6WWN1_BRUA4|nr:hypothetical protein Oant_0660 [Brucella anthropi ATCC 49188]